MIAENQKEAVPFYLDRNEGFGQAKPEDDLLHPESFVNVNDDSACETQYFGFSVPEADIHALCQNMRRPKFNLVSGGLYVFQGIKSAMVQAELCDWRLFMNDSVVTKNNLHKFRYDNGYGVEILEPLKRYHMTYSDPARENSVDLIYQAVQPVVMFGDNNHLEQTMKVTGDLVLRGKHYAVDCFNIRDRSWGKPRQETNNPIPPLDWMTGVFNEDFAFNCTVFDHASNNPHPLAVPDEQALRAGWIYYQGKLGRIVKASKRVKRGSMLEPLTVELKLSDERGRDFDMQGTLVASCPCNCWGNILVLISLMRWDCNGSTAYGDDQSCYYNDYVNVTAPTCQA
jgi:hypothetical protein